LIATQQARNEIEHHFGSLQRGVGSRLGVESIFHQVEEALRGGAAVATLDLRNAFNSAPRRVIAESIPDSMPLIAHLFGRFYSVPSELLVVGTEERLFSKRGVRQGCALGPLLFSLSIQRLLEKARDRYPGVVIRAYLDDVTLTGQPGAVITAAAFLRSEFERLGMVLSGKSMFLGDSASDADLAAAGLSRAPLSIKVLGGFLGDAAECARRLLEDFKKYDTLFEKLVELPRHIAFSVLRACGPVCAIFAARMHHPDISRDALLRFEAGIVRCLAQLLGVPEVQDCHRAQIHLPVADGGFGLMNLPVCAELLHSASRKDVQEDEAGHQRPLKKALDASIREKLLGISPAAAARLHSCSGSMSWITAISHTLRDWEWQVAARMRLGLPPSDLVEAPCSCGIMVPREEMLDHFSACRRVSGITKIHRHNEVQAALVAGVRRLGLNAVPSPPGYHADSAKNPDVLVSFPAGAMMCLDVSIVHPTAASHVGAAGARRGVICERMEAAKTAKHGAAAKAHGHDFSPFVLETYGYCGRAAERFLKSAAVASLVPGAYRELRERVAVAVQRGNALLARHGLELVKRAAIGAPGDHAPCVAAANLRHSRRKYRRCGVH
jgi:hypothetical protein